MKRFSILLLLILVLSFHAECQSFTIFLHRIENLPLDKRQQAVDSLKLLNQQSPIIEADTSVYFICYSFAKRLEIAGDFTAWKPLSLMKNLEGTNFWYYHTFLHSDTHIEYKFVINGKDWILDSLNPRIATGGFGDKSELAMPLYHESELIQQHREIPHGKLIDTAFYSQSCKEIRKIKIYLPADYKNSGNSYQLVLYHDGEDYLKFANILNILDNLAVGKINLPLIAVFVTPVQRDPEYSGSRINDYSEYIVNELMPFLEKNYRILPGPENHAVSGISNGGNIALWLGACYPHIFGKVAVHSSNIENYIMKAYKNNETLFSKIYIDIGKFDLPPLIPMFNKFELILKEGSCQYLAKTYSSGHNWYSWRNYMGEALIYLFPKTTVKIDTVDTSEDILFKAAHLAPSERQLAWQKMEFTFFIHFGMNTFTDREWGEKGTPASTFNPTALDAEQWARTAKETGAKLILMVAKHHDGFCLWQSKYNDYCVKNSPWKGGKGDVIAEVSAACRKYGLKFGVYLSPWDMNSGLYGTDEYNTYFKNQLRELLSNYGEIAEVWFDGACGEGDNGLKQVYDWPGYYTLIRELAPRAVIAVMGPDVRWVGTESGYGRETEWSVVPVSSSVLDQIALSSQHKESLTGTFKPLGNMMEDDLGSREKIMKAKGLIWYPSEVDVSIRDGWFYHAKDDTTVKSPEKLVDIYYSSVGRNSLLLLNVPPDKRGLIHENDIASLRGMRKILDETNKNVILADSNPVGVQLIFEYKLEQKKIFDILELQEDITQGQRVEKFVLEGWKEGKWVEITKGTTIGYKRILKFNPAAAEKVRIKITETRSEPKLSAIKLLKSP